MAECLAGLLFLGHSATSGVVSSIAGHQALSCLQNGRAGNDGVSSMHDAADDADASGSSVWQRCSMKATSAVADAAAGLCDMSAGVAVKLDSKADRSMATGSDGALLKSSLSKMSGVSCLTATTLTSSATR